MFEKKCQKQVKWQKTNDSSKNTSKKNMKKKFANVTHYQVLLFDMNSTNVVTVDAVNDVGNVIIAVDHIRIAKQLVDTHKHVNVCEIAWVAAVVAGVTATITTPQAKHRQTTRALNITMCNK